MNKQNINLYGFEWEETDYTEYCLIENKDVISIRIPETDKSGIIKYYKKVHSPETNTSNDVFIAESLDIQSLENKDSVFGQSDSLTQSPDANINKIILPKDKVSELIEELYAFNSQIVSLRWIGLMNTPTGHEIEYLNKLLRETIKFLRG